MPDAEAGLSAILQADANVGALVDDRLYPLRLPQNPTLPAVSFVRISDTVEHTLGVDHPIYLSRFQFSAWSAVYDEAKDVAEAVRAALSRYRGTAGGVVFSDIFFDSSLDLFDGEARLCQSVVEFLVWHNVN